MVPKEEWEWSDWRTYEIDMAYVIWEYARIGMEAIEIHYGD
jgi:hypothetical protein